MYSRHQGASEKKLQKSITRVYVGVGGMGLHSVRNSVTRHLGEKTQITEDIVRNLLDSNRTMPGNDREILEVIPQKYILGAQETDDAVGISSESIEGQFLNIVASASVNQDIRDCFHRKASELPVFPFPIALWPTPFSANPKNVPDAFL